MIIKIIIGLIILSLVGIFVFVTMPFFLATGITLTHKYNNTSYVCTNFTNDYIELMDKLGYEAGSAVVWDGEQAHSVAIVFLDVQNGEFVRKSENYTVWALKWQNKTFVEETK